MMNIVVLTHGRFGEELVNSAKMIIGDLEDVKALSLLPEMSAGEYAEGVREHLSTLDGDVIGLVDLYGGTPCNTLMGLTRDFDVKIISGVNLPMLIDVYLKKDTMDINELADAGLKTLEESGKNVSELLKTAMGGN